MEEKLNKEELDLAIKKAQMEKEREKQYLLKHNISEEEFKKERDRIENEFEIISKSGSKKEVFEILLDWRKRLIENKEKFKVPFKLSRTGSIYKKDMVGDFECFKNLNMEVDSFVFRLTIDDYCCNIITDEDKLFNKLACELKELKNKN